MTAGQGAPYRPMMSDADAERLRQWHEATYASMRARGKSRVSYLGRAFLVPEDVFAPTPVSDLFGTAVLGEVRPGDRVLDMGTGCGVNAILAAATSRRVIGVDINPSAVEIAQVNAALNGVAGRTEFFVSDVFNAVEGTFDLILFDPPFRWFRPRDLLEASIADEGYGSLTRFVEQAPSYLSPDGRILLFFGTSGDVGYLEALLARQGFDNEVLATRRMPKEDTTLTYSTRRLRL